MSHAWFSNTFMPSVVSSLIGPLIRPCSVKSSSPVAAGWSCAMCGLTKGLLWDRSRVEDM